MTTAFFALVLNGFREARRNRVSVIVALFVLITLLSSTLVTQVTIYTFERVLTDFGLGSMSIALTLLAIFLSSGMLSREIERRTLFLIVSKPISRATFLVGRLMGNMLTLLVMLVAMSTVFLIQYRLFNYTVTVSQLQALGMLIFELLVISSFGFLMSAFASQMVSAIVTTGVFFAGHLSADIYNLSSKSDLFSVRMLGKATYYLLPNLSRLNLRPMAAYELVTPAQELLYSIAYALGYSGIIIAIAVMLFSRRDFR